MSSDTAFLYAWLDATDAVCPRCRYHLRGTRSRQCPECGFELVLDRREHFDWWAAGVFGLVIIGLADLLMLLAVGIIGAAGKMSFFTTFLVLGVALLVTVILLMRQVRTRVDAGAGTATEPMRRRALMALGTSGGLSMVGMLVLVMGLVA